MTKRLLVVDDAMIIREMIKDFAPKAGWSVAGEAADGEEAIRQYKEVKPDGVTLDLVMPGYGGLHALKGIMQIDPGARVLVVSAIDQTDILKEALNHGAADFVVKPFAEERLTSALRKMATYRRATVVS